MSTAQTAARWLGLGSALGVFVFCALLLVLCCGAAPLNQLKLWMLWKEYTEHPHPPDSTVLYTYAEVGLLEGNGNHCDFIAGEQRRSALSADALRAFYAASPQLFLHFPSEADDSLSYVVRETPAWPAGSYAVYRFEWGLSDDFDIRCH